MNLILLLEQDFTAPGRAVIRDARRLEHILKVQRVELGSRLKVGLLNGKVGQGMVTAIRTDELHLEVSLTRRPPAALPLTLVLALPRPKMLRRIVRTIATLGIKDLVLINSYRVEKSYWQSPGLSAEAIRAELILGLEQAGDTLLPRVTLSKRFKPFVEDQLPGLMAGRQGLIAHPYTDTPCPTGTRKDTLLAVGPEGGFIDYEVHKFHDCGLRSVHLGERIMRVETAIPFLLGRLF